MIDSPESGAIDLTFHPLVLRGILIALIGLCRTQSLSSGEKYESALFWAPSCIFFVYCKRDRHVIVRYSFPNRLSAETLGPREPLNPI